MRKRLLGSVLMALIMGFSTLSCFGAEGSTVTLNAKSELIYENSDIEVSVAPGETFSETITIKNDYEKTADFYLNTEILKDLEASVDAGKAKGAGYEIKLLVKNAGTETTLYDSSVGGEGTETGLSNVDLQDTMLIATLAKGKSAEVVLSIFFDGEGLDNTTAADYSNAFANLSFEFKAGYEEPTGNTINYKEVVRKGEDTYVTVVSEAANTGDSLLVPGIIAVALIAGIAFIVIGKKKSTKAMMLGVAVAVLFVTGVSTYAEEATYTVTFRPGSVGEFTTTAADYTIDNTPGFVAAVDTELGAIKVTVKSGSSMPAFPNVKASEGYVENTDWKADFSNAVTKDVDFVADYAKLIDGVEYTIEYVDSVTGDSIYPAYSTLGNVGDVITATLPTMITISDSAYYYPVSGQTAKLTLKSKKEKNVLTIKYSMQSRTTTDETVVTYIDGDVITTIIPGTAPAAAVNPGGGAAAAVVTPPAIEEEAEVVNIEEEETPLANGDVVTENTEKQEPENKGGETVEITEPSVPLGPSVPASSNWLYFAGAAIVLAAVAAFAVVANKRKKAALTGSDSSETKDR